MENLIRQCVSLIIRQDFYKILLNEFKMPSASDLTAFIEEIWIFEFNEFEVESNLKLTHPEWSEERIREEMKKIRHSTYENQLKTMYNTVVKSIEQAIDNIQDEVKMIKKKYIDS
ncbi:MAG: hypothetical protein HQK79_05410 [Desulfobacterales bacterium]|nr:hypothetical protein [Desulfobacterales bacterium]MBF0398413.1 hypothetical protein [Desulfobacterales bacterium]